MRQHKEREYKSRDYKSKQNRYNQHLIENDESIQLSVDILNLLSTWNYYQNVVKDYSLNKYNLIFGDVISKIENYKNINYEIDLLIQSIITNLGKKQSSYNNDNLNTNSFKFSSLYDNFSDNFNNSSNNVNVLLNNILLKFENLKEFNENKVKFENHNSKNESLKNDINLVYKNIIKQIHPDKIQNDFIHLKINEKDTFRISCNEIFSFSKSFVEDYDIKRLTALELVLNTLKSKKLQNSKLNTQKLNYLKRWLSIENQDFISQEPFCFFETMNDTKWINNKIKTLEHKLSLEEKRFYSQKDLLNRISTIIL